MTSPDLLARIGKGVVNQGEAVRRKTIHVNSRPAVLKIRAAIEAETNETGARLQPLRIRSVSKCQGSIPGNEGGY